MPIPFIIGAIAATATAIGVGTGVYGTAKMKEAKDTMDLAKSINDRAVEKLKTTQNDAVKSMDKVGNLEIETISSFTTFSECFEKIKNRPKFTDTELESYDIPNVDLKTLKEVSIAASVIMGGLGGAALGTAGAIAASGATTTIVMAIGTASTGTAISSLTGAAATNAALAALGGGALAAGGGGIALGTTILGAATLGVGLLVGGTIFALTGSKMADKADQAYQQAKENSEKIDVACEFLEDLKTNATDYFQTIKKVKDIYDSKLADLSTLVTHKNDYNLFTIEEKVLLKNTVLLVKLLYEMCKVKIVIQAKHEGEINSVNHKDLEIMKNKTNQLLNTI